MSAIPTTQTRSTRSTRSTRPLLAGAGLAVAAAVLEGELYAYGSGSEDNPLRASFVIAGIGVVTAALLFTFGVPRWGARGAVVLSVLSLLGVVFYWAAFPAVLAVGALVLAFSTARESGGWTTATRFAVGGAGAALILQIVASVLS